MTTKIDLIKYVSNDVLWDVLLSYVDPQELGQYCRVSRAWNKAISNDTLWRKVVPGIPPNVNAKQYIDAHAVKSLDEVLVRMKSFVNTVQFNQIGSFECFFPFNPGAIASIKVGYGKLDARGEKSLRGTCVLISKQMQDNHRRCQVRPFRLEDEFQKGFSILTQPPVGLTVINDRNVAVSGIPGSDDFKFEVNELVRKRLGKLTRDALVLHNGRVLIYAEKVAQYILGFF